MSKLKSKPSETFLGAILRGYDICARSRPRVTCADIWDQVVFECLRYRDGFETMFAWDTSRAQHVNRIGTIHDVIAAGLVPGLALKAGTYEVMES